MCLHDVGIFHIMSKYTILLTLFLATLILGCADNSQPWLADEHEVAAWEIVKESLDLPANPYDYSTGNFNSLSFNRQATIGRVLFYDKSLSADGTISCASCHKQELAFSDDVDFSKGVHGNLTTRNSFAIGSFRSLADEYYSEQETVPGLFWDNRAVDVKAQMIETLANPSEMGMELNELVAAVESKPYYQSLFTMHSSLFGSNAINSDNILDCLQSFMSSIHSNGSKFDLVEDKNSLFLRMEKPFSFTPSENNGKLLFNEHCNHCHLISPFRVDTFTNVTTFRLYVREMANNGLDKVYKDKGAGQRVEYIDNSEYDGLFKIPDLRNVTLTAPYMHDGRFKTLRDVLDHYSEGIEDHPNLHAQLKDAAGNPKKLNFTEEEKNDLINFFHTLTDHNLISDKKWGDPFKR